MGIAGWGLAVLALLVGCARPEAPEAQPARDPLAWLPADRPIPAPRGYLLGREGEGFLQEIDGQKVLHLAGTHYEMGYQHGRLLRRATRENITAYLTDFALEKGHTLEELLGIFAGAEPYFPEGMREELQGLSDGSGVPYEEICATHVIPMLYHCSGAAVWGSRTADGKLYHYRSLDYACHLGKQKRIQDNAVLVVYRPEGKAPHAVVGWAGTVGCVTGMNAYGISIGEMGSGCRDEDLAGMPMWFLLREALQRSTTLEEALDVFRRGPRTCGYNFLVCDGKIPAGVALEVSRNRMEVFPAGDPKENQAPHFALSEAVRRVNHFVDPTLAGLQRKLYDPRLTEPASWMGYYLISQYLEKHAGKLDGPAMIELCRKYPKEHSCLHQAVFCPSDLRLWVSNAADPRREKYFGAQNRTFYPYSLAALLQTSPDDLPEKPPPPEPAGAEPEWEEGTAPSSKVVLSSRDPGQERLLQFYRQEMDIFPWRMRSFLKTRDVYLLQFPSPVVTQYEANNTVRAKYFRPAGEGPFPAAVVVHHLGGEFVLEEMICDSLSRKGIACLMIWLPYYGERGPEGVDRESLFLSSDLDSSRGVLRQAVLDLHRCRDWLRDRPEIDGGRVGLVGVSLGAIVGGLAAGVDPGYATVSLVIGGGDLPGILFHGSKETREIAEAMTQRGITAEQLRAAWKDIEPITFASRVPVGRVHMYNASRDEIIPRESTEALWEAFGQPKIHWYRADHYSMGMHLFDVLGKVRKHILSEE